MRGLTHQTKLLLAIWMLPLSVANAQAPVGASQPSTASGGGNVYVARMLEMFESPQYASMTAKVRHQSRLHDDTLVGAGQYWQQGAGDQRKTRFEMQTPIDNKTASFLQVFNGQYLWTDRNYPSGRQVKRLEVAILQSRLPKPGQGAYNKMLANAAVRGGISQLLVDLQRRYDFDPPRAAQWNNMPMLALVGHWRAKGLQELWPEYNSQNEEGEMPAWPAQLPHHVLLLVGQNNLFPYLIEQRRYADAYLATTVTGLRPSSDPLLRYEIYDPQFAVAIPPEKFVFKTGDVEWSDETNAVSERVLRQLR